MQDRSSEMLGHAPSGVSRMEGPELDHYAAGEVVEDGRTGPTDEQKLRAQQQDDVREFAQLESQLKKLAGEENEPEVDDHPSSPADKMRPRAEYVVYDDEGCWAIDKGDYILFPGGGVADGELPIVSGARELLEEADIVPLNIQPRQVVEALWPTESGNDFWDESPFDGERTYFFIALHGGPGNTQHDDREDFQRLTFKQLRTRLRELIADEDQAWAQRNNRVRLALVNEAARLVRTRYGLEPVKLADAAKVKPVSEYLLYTPDGRVVVGDRKNRRLRLPTAGVGRPVPYGHPVRLLPPEGVDDPDYHGYEIDLREGDVQYVPEGYRAREPGQVLQDIYAAIGMPENRPYRELDRARARAILRRMRRSDRAPAV